MTLRERTWAAPDEALGQYIAAHTEKTVRACREQPALIREHANLEWDTARGGYANRQLFELVQNGADALVHGEGEGRISIVLTESHLYCADDGKPIDKDGVTALMQANLSPKRGTREIGRFGQGFKAVLGVSDAPEFFSLTGSLHFDPYTARQRLRGLVSEGERVPTLRLPQPIDPQRSRADDRQLRALMSWATNIVRLPLRAGASEKIRKQMEEFPAEFLLFVDHVRNVGLRDAVNDSNRPLSLERIGDSLVLRDDERRSNWKVFKSMHRLSGAARQDSRTLDNADECELRWAAPLGRQSGTGYFWAFFPTNTSSLVSGILNAPWKTNEDRQSLLPGVYNEELIEAAATLIAENLPKLATARDPGRHLDALPRRREAGDSKHSVRLRQCLLARLACMEVIPDQTGKLRSLHRLRCPPEVTTKNGRDALDLWSVYPHRPTDWIHQNVVMRPTRFSQLDRLADVAFRADLPRASVAAWLESLVRDQKGDALTKASMVAVQVAAKLPRDRWRGRLLAPDDYGQIVLTSGLELRAPDPANLYLPGSHGIESPNTLVHGELVADQETKAALSRLGFETASARTRFERMAEVALNSEEPVADSIWDAFWRFARLLSSSAAVAVIHRETRRREPHVLTGAGAWARPNLVLLPGPIIECSDVANASVAVDTEYHAPDLELLKGIGVVAEPQEDVDLSGESWYKRFLARKRSAFASRELPSKPRWHYMEFKSTSGCGPLELMDRLPPAAAARYTESLLRLDSSYRCWVMWHCTQDKVYPRLECESPVIMVLRKHGWVNTKEGPVSIRDALGPEPENESARNVLLGHPNSERIKRAFNLIEPDPVFTGEEDPIALVDLWPGLREYLPDSERHVNLRGCEHITVAGNLVDYIAYEGDFYVTNALSKEEQLVRALDSLGLSLDRDELDAVITGQTRVEIMWRRSEVAMGVTADDRLLRAAGEPVLRMQLGDSTVAALEAQHGPMTGDKLAQAFIAIWHTDALRRLKSSLRHLGPPRQWAGSRPAIDFVESLGFSREWAGQRRKRGDHDVEVAGPVRLGTLHVFQRKIVDKMRSLLGNSDGLTPKKRGMVCLPTGAGKTRVAVQALVEAIRDDGLDTRILWIADRDELCEQAVDSWSQVWSRRGVRRQLRIARMWGSRPEPKRADGPQVIVTSIQTLGKRLTERVTEGHVLGGIGVVVIDEAHRSIAPIFTRVTTRLGLTPNQKADEPFLFGLTATPYRGRDERETERLVNRYAGNRLDQGAFASSNAEHVVRTLQRECILALVDEEMIGGGNVRLTRDEIADIEKKKLPWLPSGAEIRLGKNMERTRRIVQAFDDHIPRDWPTLVFATSVEHAGILAALLDARGIRARAVSAQTERATRRQIVEDYRNGKIQALVNYAIFREGFDAPGTRAIVVARPVYSPNLYFQMIGRGMRGVKNGGNDRCLVLNVRDNVENFDRALAFTEMDWLWSREDDLPDHVTY